MDWRPDKKEWANQRREFFESCQQKNRWGKSRLMDYEAGADAMLKEIVVLLKACDGELVSRNNKPFMATFEMLAETWQSLSEGAKE